MGALQLRAYALTGESGLVHQQRISGTTVDVNTSTISIEAIHRTTDNTEPHLPLDT